MIKSGLEIHRQIYREECKTYQNLLVTAKCDYHKQQISGSNQRQLFKVVDSISNGKSDPILPNHDNEKELAEQFADFFTSKVKDIQDTLDQVPKEPISVNVSESCHTVFATFQHVSEEEVRKVISNSPTKSCSLDPIPTWLLKDELLDILLPVITRLINSSLSEGKFPVSFKKARVVPLIKKSNADRDSLKNYRPISNLSFVSKITERIVASALQKYLEDNELYANRQSAYRTCHSTETALLRVNNDLLRAVDVGNECLLVLLDFSSAFDVIDQHKFLERLVCRYGITGQVHDWFSSYISGRTQQIVIGENVSEPQELNQGVPQGSVVGPLCFAMYAGPLQDIINAHGLNCMTYADDTQVYITSSVSDRATKATQLELCMKDIKAWTVENRLLLNDTKTEVIHVRSRFRNSDPFPQVTIGTAAVTAVSDARNLGVTIDSTLQLKKHVNNICRAATMSIRKIGQIRPYLDQCATERLVHAFITSRLDSCNSLLFGLPDNQICKLQRVQNMAARLVSLTKKHDHISPVLDSLHWLTVKNRIVYKLLLLTYKALNGQTPPYICELLKLHVPGHSGLRSGCQNLLHVPRYSTSSYGLRAFSVAAPKLWNRLPLEIRNSRTVNNFKSMLKTHLFKFKNVHDSFV
jgi:hypothetical protein